MSLISSSLIFPSEPVVQLLDAGLTRPAAGVFTTRIGGVSRGPWTSANLALHVQDDEQDVLVNRSRLAAEIRLSPERLVFGQQVHGAGVAVVDDRLAVAADRYGIVGVDALVTAVPGTGLVMLAADCLPVLFADPIAGVVAAAHAGRRGLISGVLQATLRAMTGIGARIDRVEAVLGPAVCGRCYELPAEVADDVERTVPGSRITTARGTVGVDLVDGAEGLLHAAGLAEIRRVGGCTVEQPARFFSYRRDDLTGRHAGVSWLA